MLKPHILRPTDACIQTLARYNAATRSLSPNTYRSIIKKPTPTPSMPEHLRQGNQALIIFIGETRLPMAGEHTKPDAEGEKSDHQQWESVITSYSIHYTKLYDDLVSSLIFQSLIGFMPS